MPDDLTTPRFPPATRGAVAITHVDVVPMDEPHTLPDQTVILREGTIIALGPSAQVPVDGAIVVDGRGKYLMPGLADMHVHYWDIGEFALFLANGVTLVRNMWGSPFHLALRRKVNEGGFPGPRVVTTSPIIDGPGPNGTTIWPGSAMAADPAQATALVREYAARGYEQIKAYSWLKLDVLRALGTASLAGGLRTVGHCPDGITYEEAIDAGMTCFEHLTGIVTGRMGGRSLLGLRMGSLEAFKTVLKHFDPETVRPLAGLLAARQIWNCPTLVVWQGMAQDEQTAMSNPLLCYEPASTVGGWNPANDFRLRSTTASRADWLALARARNELYLRCIAILHGEGAPLLLGTDTPNPFVFHGFAVHDELANFVAAGLSPYQALRTGTVEAARFLGEEEDWGTVATGKRADLILLGANPLQDLTATRQPEAVFVNGYVFARDDLDRLLRQRADAMQSRRVAAAPALSAWADGEVVLAGALVERVADSEVGRIRYRHTRGRDGTWLVEETARGTADSLRAWGGTTTTRLVLSPSLEVMEAERRGESFLGTEEYRIQQEEDGGYAAQMTELDGFQRTLQVDGPLVAGEDLAFTAVPLLLGQSRPAGTIQMLGIGAQPMAMPMEVAKADDVWTIHVDRAGTAADQTYHLAADGALLRMEEQSWRGRREILPVSEGE